MTDHQCQYVHGSGKLCGSPRMNNKNYCFHHARLYDTFILPGSRLYETPALTDYHNIQIALSHVYRAQTKGLINPVQARAILYNIQMALATLKRLDTPPPEEIVTEVPRRADTPARAEGCSTDIPVCDRREATASEPPSNSDSDDKPEPKYDPACPPLCHEPALRPLVAPKPRADAPAVWVPMSDAEIERMNNYKYRVPGDYTYDHYLRRLKLSTAFLNTPDPTPDQIAAAIAKIEEDDADLAREREAEVQRLRARKRDLRNRELAGF